MTQGWFVNSATFTQVLSWGQSVVGISGSSNMELKDGKEKGVVGVVEIRTCKEEYPNGFQMPLRYPRYTKQDYDNMADFKLDMLLKEYGLSFKGSLEEKRAYAIGAFLWPQQQL